MIPTVISPMICSRFPSDVPPKIPLDSLRSFIRKSPEGASKWIHLKVHWIFVEGFILKGPEDFSKDSFKTFSQKYFKFSMIFFPDFFYKLRIEDFSIKFSQNFYLCFGEDGSRTYSKHVYNDPFIISFKFFARIFNEDKNLDISPRTRPGIS